MTMTQMSKKNSNMGLYSRHQRITSLQDEKAFDFNDDRTQPIYQKTSSAFTKESFSPSVKKQ